MTPHLEEDKMEHSKHPGTEPLQMHPSAPVHRGLSGDGGGGHGLIAKTQPCSLILFFFPPLYVAVISLPLRLLYQSDYTAPRSDPSPCSHTGLIPLLRIGFGFGSLLQVKLTRNKKDKPFRRFQWSTDVQLSNNKECV